MYNYAEQRKELFTEDGMRIVLEVRDKAMRAIRDSGAVQMGKLFVGGLSWNSLAAVDYLIERKEIREVTGPDVAGQDRVFVKYE